MKFAQKMKFFIEDFFSKCDQIRRKLRIWSHLLKKCLMKNFIFCAVLDTFPSKCNIAKMKPLFNPFTPCDPLCGHNTDLLSNSNISKTVRVNIAFITAFLKEYFIRFLIVSRLIDFACDSLVIDVNFSGTERVKQIKKKLKTTQNHLGL